MTAAAASFLFGVTQPDSPENTPGWACSQLYLHQVESQPAREESAAALMLAFDPSWRSPWPSKRWLAVCLSFAFALGQCSAWYCSGSTLVFAQPFRHFSLASATTKYSHIILHLKQRISQAAQALPQATQALWSSVSPSSTDRVYCCYIIPSL